jgi:uncharacterized protein VirK/YbjX
MLTKPFSGKELFIEYEIQMGRLVRFQDEEETNYDEIWDNNGKTKKQSWNNLAKLINRRMDEELLESKINKDNL